MQIQQAVIYYCRLNKREKKIAQQAEEWLHAEAKSKGWSKWAKIQTRTATQGLIGVCSKNNVGVMVEINCETDFVSRNAEFQQLVGKMLSGCVSYAENLELNKDITKVALDELQLSTIQCEMSSLGELVVAAAMKFNEKTVAKRAVFLKVPDDVLLNSLTHPATICSNLNGASLGKYGVLLAAKEKSAKTTDTTEDTTALRLNMCHHIIGLNPLSVGELTDKDIAKFSETKSEEVETAEKVQSEHKTVDNQTSTSQSSTEQNAQSENEDDSSDLQTEGQETLESELKESNETELLFQSFLMDPTVTVGETLFKSGIEVLAFERFECGEIAEESPEVVMKASA